MAVWRERPTFCEVRRLAILPWDRCNEHGTINPAKRLLHCSLKIRSAARRAWTAEEEESPATEAHKVGRAIPRKIAVYDSFDCFHTEPRAPYTTNRKNPQLVLQKNQGRCSTSFNALLNLPKPIRITRTVPKLESLRTVLQTTDVRQTGRTGCTAEVVQLIHALASPFNRYRHPAGGRGFLVGSI